MENKRLTSDKMKEFAVNTLFYTGIMAVGFYALKFKLHFFENYTNFKSLAFIIVWGIGMGILSICFPKHFFGFSKRVDERGEKI